MAIETALVVDKTEKYRLSFKRALQDLKIKEVATASTSEEALTVFMKENVQLVVASWDIQTSPCAILAQKVRARSGNKYLPCVTYSERLTDDDIFLARELAFNSILRLPLKSEEIFQELKKVIDSEQELTRNMTAIRKIEKLTEQGSYSEALELVKPELLEDERTFLLANTVVGELWYWMKKLDKCEDHVRQILDRDPLHAPGLQLKARLKSAHGSHEEAIEILSEMAELAPKNISTMLTLGDAYLSADRLEDARNSMDAVEEMDPEREELREGRGRLAFKEGDLDAARDLLAHVGHGIKLARFFNDMGIALVSKGDYDAGIKTYQDALTVLADKTKKHLLYFNLALAHRKHGDLASAFEALSQSYIHEPNYEKAYTVLLRVAKEMKDAGLPLDTSLVKAVKKARAAQPKRAA